MPLSGIVSSTPQGQYLLRQKINLSRQAFLEPDTKATVSPLTQQVVFGCQSLKTTSALYPFSQLFQHTIQTTRFGRRGPQDNQDVRVFQPASTFPEDASNIQAWKTDPKLWPQPVPKIIAHDGFYKDKAFTFQYYYLADPGVSEKLILTPQNASPQHLRVLFDNYFKPWKLFTPPLYSPEVKEKNQWTEQLKEYSDLELSQLRKRPQNDWTTGLVTSIPSQGADFNKGYWYWWLRDSEAVAFPLNSAKKQHWLAERMSYTNLHWFLAEKRDAVKPFILYDDVRDRVGGHFLIKSDPLTGELNQGWGHLQLDALGMHMAALASHLKEHDGLKWKNLTPEDKEAFCLLYGFITRFDYANHKDLGPWEEKLDYIRSSSVGMVTKGMLNLQELLFVSPEGEQIQQDMKKYFESLCSDLPAPEKEKRLTELLSPLKDSEMFEKTLVAPGFLRLYKQLPQEGFGDRHFLCDSATLMVPFYAPEVLEKMAAMKAKHFPDLPTEPQWKMPAKSDPAIEMTKMILNDHKRNLWRRSGIVRYAWDKYERKHDMDPEWTLFAPMHAALWFKIYMKTHKTEDFVQGLDAWNLAMSSLVRYKDIRNPKGADKVKWMESVIPHPDGWVEPNRVRDLAWTHAAAQTMWQAIQPAVELYQRQLAEGKA
jgi:hypothetical protein